MKSLQFIVAITLFICLPQSLFSQSTVVNGHIYEKETNAPIAYAKVFFTGTQVGAYTDTNGYFSLAINAKNLQMDSVTVSYLGFDSHMYGITKDSTQSLEVYLVSNLFLNLDDIVVRPGENPAWHFLRKIIEAKDRNNPEKLDYYSSHEYAKVRFDLNHFTDKIKKTLLLKPFDYIWDNAQETEDGIAYLPALITEQLLEHYYRKSPKDSRDLIISEKRSGLAGPNLIEFTNDLYITPNVYDNYVDILGKSFPSPLNDNYRSNYKFYLMDSTVNEEGKTYRINFVPKFKRQIAFTGEMYIDSASYAVKEITLRFDIKANVNFIRSYYTTQKFEKVDGTHWLPSEINVVGDFTVVENASDLTGFFGRKHSVYSDYTINETIDKSHFKGIEKVVYLDSSLIQSEEYWAKNRPIELSDEEEKLEELTERVKNDPAFKIRMNLIHTLGFGYIPFNPLELGIYSMFSYNDVEKFRLKMDLRTDPNQKFPIHFKGHVAYGFGDKEVKYKIGTTVRLNKKNTLRIGGHYLYDLQQVGRSFNLIDFDHTLGALAQVGETSSQNYVTEIEGYVETELFKGALVRVGYFNKKFAPVSGNSFNRLATIGSDTLNIESYQGAGLRGTFKFSYLYGKLTGNFYDRKDLYKEFRRFPDVAISYDYSDKKLFGSQFDYQKVKLSLRQKVNLKKLGNLRYTLEVGKTMGEVPYTFLDIPFGNQLVISDVYSFNLMNFMEYASDEYVILHLEHHFEGLILDRIPLINKLKMRSFVFGKTFIGSISEANNQQTDLFPKGLTGIDKPYIEFGFGAENIFKFLRVDFIFRTTPGLSSYYSFFVKPSFILEF